MRDALGLTLDQVYQWRILLEEYRPKIVYIEGIHNTVADAILGCAFLQDSFIFLQDSFWSCFK